jgi:hypothetical protein
MGLAHGLSHRHAVRYGSPALEVELQGVGVETKHLSEMLRAVMAKYTELLGQRTTPVVPG